MGIEVSADTMTDDDKRIFQIAELLASGLKRFDIIELVTNSDNKDYQWNLDETEIDYLINKAKENMLDNITGNQEEWKASIFAKYDFLYKKLTTGKKYADAMYVVDRMKDLMLPKVK